MTKSFEFNGVPEAIIEDRASLPNSLSGSFKSDGIPVAVLDDEVSSGPMLPEAPKSDIETRYDRFVRQASLEVRVTIGLLDRRPQGQKARDQIMAMVGEELSRSSGDDSDIFDVEIYDKRLHKIFEMAFHRLFHAEVEERRQEIMKATSSGELI